jgi:hypothetical protein
MDDNGISIEWPKMCIRLFPPDDEIPDKLEVVIHNLLEKKITEFYVEISDLKISENFTREKELLTMYLQSV